jgi:hypothetical protein
MEFYEQAVMWYVTSGGQRFVCPQFCIHDGEGKGWESEPDFVALDLTEGAIYVIEVSSGSVARPAARLADNLKKNCEYLRKNLRNANVDLSKWPIKVRVFTRDTYVDKFVDALRKKSVQSPNLLKGVDIQVLPIEKSLCNWTWYDENKQGVASLEGKKLND